VENPAFPYYIDMKEHEMRFRIPQVLFKRFKLVCIQNDLSIPKQSAELIRKFVEILEEDTRKIQMAQEENKKLLGGK
jgi:hypothetical protein